MYLFLLESWIWTENLLLFLFIFLPFFKFFSFYQTCIRPSFHICFKRTCSYSSLLSIPLLLNPRATHFSILVADFFNIYLHFSKLHSCLATSGILPILSLTSDMKDEAWACFHPLTHHVHMFLSSPHILPAGLHCDWGRHIQQVSIIITTMQTLWVDWASYHTVITYPSQQSSLFVLTFAFVCFDFTFPLFIFMCLPHFIPKISAHWLNLHSQYIWTHEVFCYFHFLREVCLRAFGATPVLGYLPSMWVLTSLSS